jgi:hypothetical protein
LIRPLLVNITPPLIFYLILYIGITFWVNASMSNINFTNIQITGAPYAVEVHGWGGTGEAFFNNVSATNLSSGGMYFLFLFILFDIFS